jgi:hypothetical protein
VMRRVVFRPQAEDDALEVRTWYESRRGPTAYAPDGTDEAERRW